MRKLVLTLEGIGPVIRYLAFIAALAAMPVASRAEHECQSLDWLVRLYHMSLVLTDGHGQGPANRAVLSDLRGAISFDQLDDRLAEAGLSDRAPQITAFLRDLNRATALVRENPAANSLPPLLMDRIRTHSKMIGGLLDTLRCDVDPAWRPDSVAQEPASPSASSRPASPPAAISAEAPTASADRPRPRSQLETWTFPEPPIWLVVLGLLLVPFTIVGNRIYEQWTAVRKRRWRRYYCHIGCAVLFPGTGPGRLMNGTIVDISQMGAKVFIGKPLSQAERSVQILFAGHRIKARVVWSNTLFFGVVFHDPLPRGELQRLISGNREERRARSLKIT